MDLASAVVTRYRICPYSFETSIDADRIFKRGWKHETRNLDDLERRFSPLFLSVPSSLQAIVSLIAHSRLFLLSP